MNMTLLYLLFSHLRPLKHVQHVWNWWLEKENEKVGETVREAWGQFAAALQQGRTFFISHRVKKVQVIEKETVQQPIRHRCQRKALEVLDY